MSFNLFHRKNYYEDIYWDDYVVLCYDSLNEDEYLKSLGYNKVDKITWRYDTPEETIILRKLGVL